MKKLGFVLALTIFLTGCYVPGDTLFSVTNYVQNRASEIEYVDSPKIKALSGKYSFVVLTDIHFGSKRQNPPALPNEAFFKWMDELKLANKLPDFCLILGDIADTGFRDEYYQYEEFANKIKDGYGIEVFNTVGNHDLYQKGWSDWVEFCYPHTSFYTFKSQNFSFYSLDTGSTNLGPKQMQAFKRTIEKDPNPKIVFTHYPLYTKTLFFCQEDTTERNLLMSYCAKNNVKLYLAGHLHWYEEVDYGSFQAYVIPSYRYKGQWALVNVDESKSDYTMRIISKTEY